MKMSQLSFFISIFFTTSAFAQDPSAVGEPGTDAVSDSSSEVSETSEDEEDKIKEGEWEASPQNWKNSKHNYENSTYNFSNSPKNFFNKENNPKRVNIVNVFGIVVGYVIRKADGGVNYFDNDGVRLGYSPDGGKSQFDVSGKPTKFKLEEK